MTQYKFSLSKYRVICPKCGKKTFSLFLDNATNEPISDSCGRCNRENSCGWIYTPKDYYRDHGVINDAKGQWEQPRRVVPALEPPASYIDLDIMTKTLVRDSSNNNFVNYLRTLARLKFNTAESERKVATAIGKMFIGTAKTGDVLFWQCDQFHNVHAGKIMKYDPDGHRHKNPDGDKKDKGFSWVHNYLLKKGIVHEFNLKQCLFGLHQLAWDQATPAAIVESEKTALVGTIFLPEYIWLATGGSHNLKAEKCLALQGRQVTLFPDLGMFDLWVEKAKEISRVVPDIKVSKYLERRATDEDRAKGLDLADFIERGLGYA